MSIFSFILEIYFATMLCVSGLAKLNGPAYFTDALRQQGILPSWSIIPSTKIFPWIEIIVSLLLIAGVLAIWNSLLLFTLFTIFAGLKIVLLLKGYDKDCGCFVSAKPQRVDAISVTVAILLVLFTGLHIWFVFHTPFTSWIWRLSLFIVALIVVVYSSIRIGIKSKMLLSTAENQSSNIEEIKIGRVSPIFTAVDQYNNLVDSKTFRGKLCILLFVLPGCSACPDALKALQRLSLKEKNLLSLVIASPDTERNRAYAAEHTIRVPVLTSTSSLLEEYKIQVFPFAIFLDAEGVVRAAGVALGYEQLRILLLTTRKRDGVEMT